MRRYSIVLATIVLLCGYAMAQQSNPVPEQSPREEGSTHFGSLRIEKDEKGQPKAYFIRLGPLGVLGRVYYADLNADGIIDSMADLRSGNPKCFIFFEQKLVPVNTGKRYHHSKAVRSEDGRIDYAFEDGRWTIKLKRKKTALEGEGRVRGM